MTIQEEKMQRKAEEFGKLAPVFLEGAEFALNNQWISVNDDLPCKHKELVEYDVSTVLVFVKTKYSTTGTDYMRLYGDFTWRWERYHNITHWMLIPKLPKESEIELTVY